MKSLKTLTLSAVAGTSVFAANMAMAHPLAGPHSHGGETHGDSTIAIVALVAVAACALIGLRNVRMHNASCRKGAGSSSGNGGSAS